MSWERTVDRERALRIPGLFANPNTACRLRDRFTIDQVTEFFGIAVESAH